jgi:RNA polymerase sigma-70 factor, ECF subfamily
MCPWKVPSGPVTEHLLSTNCTVERLNPTLEAREHRLRDLLVAAQRGDAAAYADFLRELASLLRGFFRRRLTQLPDEVEDLVQETLLAVHNKRHTYEPQQPVTAWLHAIARYKLIDLLRARSGREALHEPLDDEHAALVSDAEPAALEARRDLAVLLADLPDKQRLPIQYVKIEGLSVAQAAQRTGLSESAVKVGVHRGLKALAARIRSTR